MAIGTKRVGVTSGSIDGSAQDIIGTIEYSLNSVKREPMTGMSGVHGYKETPVPAMISFTVRDSSTLSVADYEAMTNSTVEFQLGNGKQIVGTNCCIMDVQTVSADEASIKLTFNTDSLVEV